MAFSVGRRTWRCAVSATARGEARRSRNRANDAAPVVRDPRCPIHFAPGTCRAYHGRREGRAGRASPDIRGSRDAVGRGNRSAGRASRGSPVGRSTDRPRRARRKSTRAATTAGLPPLQRRCCATVGCCATSGRQLLQFQIKLVHQDGHHFFINSIILLAIENSLKMNGNLKKQKWKDWSAKMGNTIYNERSETKTHEPAADDCSKRTEAN